jgi:hypothetical protein
VSALAERPDLDFAERDRRWRRVRDGMTERDIDLLIVLPESNPIDVLYLSGGEQGAILVPLDGDPWILLGGEDSNLAVEREGWISQRESATPFGSTKVPYGSAGRHHVSRSLASTATSIRTCDRPMATPSTPVCAASSTRSMALRS